MSSPQRTARPGSMQPSRRTRPVPQSRNQPARQSRNHVASYHEETTSDDATDQQELEDSGARRGSHSLRPSSTAETRRSYREQSTDGSSGELSDDQNLENEAQRSNLPTTSQSTAASQSPVTSAPPAARASPRARRGAPLRPTTLKRTPTKSKALGQPLKKKKKITATEEFTLRPGVIPPWQTLPYHILFDIFLRAFPPLDGPTSQATKTPGKAQETKSPSTLLGIAVLCRAFCEPALAAFYFSPPVFSAYNGHALLNLLSKPRESLSINYAGKIRELCIDAETVLTLKSGPTLGYFDLHQVLRNTPQLHTLRLYHQQDVIFGYPTDTLGPAKWSYSESLFSTINESHISLRSWEWNGRFLFTDDLLRLMSKTHSSSPFRNVRSLRLVHILYEQVGLADGGLADGETVLAAALQALPAIEHLEFHECPIMRGGILESLPLTLQSLTISNCDRLFSDHVVNMMKIHGEQLRELNLNHNRHMSMEFMPHLGQLCPNLKRFRVDVSMFDATSYHDLDPHFSQLLSISQKPSWPDRLQEIELYQLRPWKVDVGEMFFESLVEAAPNLKDLRRLDISAILSGPWRDRAHFRDKWVRRLEKVFLRRSPLPRPNPHSLLKGPVAFALPPPGESVSVHPPLKGNSPPAPSKRHSSRIAQQKIPEALESEQMNLSDSDVEGVDPENIQGMCEHISVRIDNQRPADHQFTECDFLDDELSGDEDYDEDNDGFEPEDGHAW